MKNPLIICLSLACCLSAGAQQNRPPRQEFSPERFNQRLESFVANEAGLTPDEAAKLFPMLHEMLDKQRKNIDADRALMRSLDKNTTEAQYAEIVEKSIDCELANKKLEKTYYHKFHSVLSWQKVFKVRMALDKFRMEVMRRFAPPRQNVNPAEGWKWGERPEWHRQRPQQSRPRHQDKAKK